MTNVSPQRQNKNDYIQFRIESQLKKTWKEFLAANNLNQSDLFRRWIIAYMRKHAHEKPKYLVGVSWRFNGPVEDMPLRPE